MCEYYVKADKAVCLNWKEEGGGGGGGGGGIITFGAWSEIICRQEMVILRSFFRNDIWIWFTHKIIW